jgi:hypothetical protein
MAYVLPKRVPTWSGLKRQDNDLIVIESAEAAAAFKRAFEGRYASGELLSTGATTWALALRPSD